jgi:hypothetical protein
MTPQNTLGESPDELARQGSSKCLYERGILPSMESSGNPSNKFFEVILTREC